VLKFYTVFKFGQAAAATLRIYTPSKLELSTQDANHVCRREKLANNKTHYQRKKQVYVQQRSVIKRADDKSGSKQVIPAHRFVLSISSPVFEAMFYSELAETTDYIELPDCEYDSLLELFRYLYSDEVNFSESNVMGVLYLAK